MAEDFSELAADSMWPTSQRSGVTTNPASALTAPGTPSLPDRDVPPEPFVQPIPRRAEGLTTDGEDGPQVGPIRWTRAGG